jgi:hypothetical protein
MSVKVLLTSVLTACASPGAVSAYGDVVERQPASTPIVGAEGVFVWSRFEPHPRRYELVMTKGGRITRLPVAPRGAPFDVQVVRGPDGRLLAVYSRCRKDRTTSSIPFARLRGRRLRAFDFAARRERRLHVVRPEGVTSMFLPAISGRWIAFAARR